MKWLFIDDGAGNITNPDGVGYRYDIICADHVMRNEHMIPYSIHQTNFIVRSEDLRYPGNLSSKKWFAINPVY